MAQDYAEALKLARRFARSVQKAGIRLEAAYLFGSYATGHAGPDSDIDVALVSPDFSGWVDDFDKLREPLRDMDSRIELIHLPPQNFCDENPLAWEVKTKGIPLIKPRKKTPRAASPSQRPRVRNPVPRASARRQAPPTAQGKRIVRHPS